MKKGFTLVELLAVIIILGILAAAGGVTYSRISKKHQEDACKALENDLKNVAIEYYQDNNKLHNTSILCSNIATFMEYGKLGYSTEEFNKISNITYADADDFYICVSESNGNYTASGFYKKNTSGKVNTSVSYSLCN